MRFYNTQHPTPSHCAKSLTPIFQCGGVDERTIEKFKKEAEEVSSLLLMGGGGVKEWLHLLVDLKI